VNAPSGQRRPGGIDGFGVYIHIPFCARRCDYCAFATWTDRHHLIDGYVDSLVADIERQVARGLPAATSIFVGGGTPSLVPGDRLASVLDRIPRVDGAEITVECNPDTVTPELLGHYGAAGVNRLSLGVQSMVPHVLAALGRTHERANVHTAVDLARREGIASLNVDLIYGAAGETLDDWRRTVEAAIGLDPQHVSAYGLTVEAGTRLAEDPARHPDDDDQADKYLLAAERLGAAGYGSYEISNWSKPGAECRHNLLYWSQGDYRGFGCAAHSHVDGRRWWNVRTPERYIELVADGQATEAGHEILDDDRRRLEGLQLALRTSSGVPDHALSGPDQAALTGLIEHRGERVVLTIRGRLLANEVAVRLR
jgi:putative oxygen-independent coproporphyrinogen III oxidase